jgi:hypothetical protein
MSEEQEEAKQACVCDRRNSKLVAQTPRGYKMDRVCNVCGRIMEKDAPVTTFEGFIRAWIHGQSGKKKVLRHYRVIADDTKLIYRGRGRNVKIVGDDVLALKLKDGRIIGNASRLDRCGSYRRGNEAPAQRVMFQLNLAMIPFSVFEEAKLDIQTAKVIEQGAEEDLLMPKMVWNESQAMMQPVNCKGEGWVRKKPKTDKNLILLNVWEKDGEVEARNKSKKIKKDEHGRTIWKIVKGWGYKFIDKRQLETRHFVGAMLLSVSRKYFLFDIDRREVEHYRFNPFLTQLPSKATSIREAYELLKPVQVKKALKQGLKVQRQGEWFFIPVSKIPKIPKMGKELEKKLKNYPKLEEYDLNNHGFYLGIQYHQRSDYVSTFRISKVNLGDMLPKYRKAALDRVRDLNKAILSYKKFLQQKEEFESKFNFYERGGNLKAGSNRPNRVEKLLIFNGVHYVNGNVRHTGREHEDLHLDKWHIAVPNTAIQSFTIVGDID